ncbi:Asp-tRNA(Asn)/Glu-tRNA(Gln) amidotransferase subunit GatC [Ethanoligenens harbinense]|uniref:Aspartyl/glutamyl-tRNA(Asn/Gln) amidotransferase subunit C n=1 Tax=Ethanoligenens harbinense (strain DSM 18485 / JCM 12961 / CGMCC 1.5033 / YUAN-3) TaxID=663278 RepID=E6U494_ETHHY|nr:Asp-tRNA(Asn)/Glu-tRNA(Gln) amidotransferase subunit GatC [Ethanoligenens harbinense]ADU26594.1 glutamyl-tRNA(Gln) amidotransferase, C subunit [Ethanoligenens harbinense YUAN-3]
MEEIDVRHLAKLSRLRFDEAAADKMAHDMRKIVDMVAELPDFEETETATALDVNDRMELRKDEVGPSLTRGQVLQNAPKTEAGCVVVPKTVE